jgi:hypothetical protein
VKRGKKIKSIYRRGFPGKKYVFFVVINVANQSTIVDCGQFHQSTIVD